LPLVAYKIIRSHDKRLLPNSANDLIFILRRSRRLDGDLA